MKYSIRILIVTFLLSIAAGEKTVMASEENTGVYLIINFDVRPEKQTEFEGIMRGVSAAMQSEAGFEEAFVFLDGDLPNKFVLIERWQSKALHRAHYDRIVQSGDWAHILSMLKAEPSMSYTRLFAH